MTLSHSDLIDFLFRVGFVCVFVFSLGVYADGAQ